MLLHTQTCQWEMLAILPSPAIAEKSLKIKLKGKSLSTSVNFKLSASAQAHVESVKASRLIDSKEGGGSNA